VRHTIAICVLIGSFRRRNTKKWTIAGGKAKKMRQKPIIFVYAKIGDQKRKDGSSRSSAGKLPSITQVGIAHPWICLVWDFFQSYFREFDPENQLSDTSPTADYVT
jgi:hypothetical protein